MANPCLQPQQSDFRGYPFTIYTETKTENFQKNNCSGSQFGSWEEYSKTYTSTISEDDLQQKIEDDSAAFNAAGQANANANGTCSTSCNVTQRTPYYIPAAINSSQIWANTPGYYPGTPQTKASWNNGELLARQGVITNFSSQTPWITKYPHTTGSEFYGIQTFGTNNISLLNKTASSGTPCSFVPSRIIYTGKDIIGTVNMCGTSTGIILTVIYNSIFSSEKGIDIIYVDYDTGMAELLLYVPRPSHPDYKGNSSMMVYDGSAVYVWLKFQNRTRPFRTRTGIYRINFSGSSKTITTLQDPTSSPAYSNNGADPIVACYAGSNLFFIYGERTGAPVSSFKRNARIYTIYGNPPSLPPNNFFQYNGSDDPNVYYMYGLRDSTNGNFYIGTGFNRLARYNSSGNSWTVLRQD